MKSIPFNLKLKRKKRRIYILLFVSALLTFLMVASFNYYLLEIRKNEGSIFLVLSEQRSASQNVMNMLFTETNDEAFYQRIHEKAENWYVNHPLFFRLVKEKNKQEKDEIIVDKTISEMQKLSKEIDDLILGITNKEQLDAIIPRIVQQQDQYIAYLNILSRITLQSSNQQLNRLIVIVSASIFIALLSFAYLFIFQIRPLFNQIFHKNEELRKISSKQSHIYRAPLANILGLLYLIENAESTDELLEYVRLIRLNAEAMDDRIHRVVEHAEQLFDFDGNSNKGLNNLIVMDKEEIK